MASNAYWGEEEAKRVAVCTSTLIAAGTRRVLVDPGLEDGAQFASLLDERCGVTIDDIDAVFLTHFHKGHRRSLRLFPKAVWLMSRTELRWRQNREETSEPERDILARIIPFEEHLLPGVEMIATPGHTHGSASLLFETREGMVVVAGDAVHTFDHFQDRAPAESSEDFRETRRSIDRIAKVADLIIPGHGNYFVV